MYAIIQTGGKQYRISEGDTIFVEKLNADADSVVDFNNILAIGKDDGIIVDSTTLKNAKVLAKVLKNGKAKKITVFTYKAKKGCARKMGHRQPYTKVQIESIII